MVCFGLRCAGAAFFRGLLPVTRIAGGLACAFGGAAGNLIDILRYERVTDFIDLKWWPVFNLADVAIVGGLLVAFWPELGPMRPVLFRWHGLTFWASPTFLYLGLVSGVFAGNAAAHAIGLDAFRVYVATLVSDSRSARRRGDFCMSLATGPRTVGAPGRSGTETRAISRAVTAASCWRFRFLSRCSAYWTGPRAFLGRLGIYHSRRHDPHADRLPPERMLRRGGHPTHGSPCGCRTARRSGPEGFRRSVSRPRGLRCS